MTERPATTTRVRGTQRAPARALRRGAASALLGLAAVTLVACPPSLRDPQRFTARPRCTLTIDVARDLLAARCVGCHGGARPQGSLDLSAPGALAALHGARSSTCSTQVLIDPLYPQRGFFFDKLTDTPRCGAPMPLGGTPLSPAEIDCLRAYSVDALDAGPDDRGTNPDASAPLDAAPDARRDASTDGAPSAARTNEPRGPRCTARG